MTTWVDIPDIEIATGKRITQVLMHKYRDNMRAFAEDDASVNPLDTLKAMGRQNRVLCGVGADDGSSKFQVFGTLKTSSGFAINSGAGTDATTLAYVSFQRANIEKGWVGFGDGANSLMRLRNTIGNISIHPANKTIFDQISTSSFSSAIDFVSALSAVSAGRSLDWYHNAANPYMRVGGRTDVLGAGGMFSVWTSVDLGTTPPVERFTIDRLGGVIFGADPSAGAAVLRGTGNIYVDSGGAGGVGTTVMFRTRNAQGQALATYSATDTAVWSNYYFNGALFPRYLDIAVRGSPDNTNGRGIIRFLANTKATGTDAVEVCRIDGDDGTFRMTKAIGGLGYGVGAGGSVTQITSKSTGVTLDRPTGQITMNNASLGATTAVSFTLTNSQIAADDTVSVVIKSGATANSYNIEVTAVAAGSCRIQIRNFTGGALGEALVLQFNVIKGSIT